MEERSVRLRRTKTPKLPNSVEKKRAAGAQKPLNHIEENNSIGKKQ